MTAVAHHLAGVAGTWAGTAALGVATVVATVDTTQVTIAGIGAAGTVATGLLVYFQARASRRADEARDRADGTHRLVDQLQEQLAASAARQGVLEHLVDELRHDLDETRLGVARLIGQLQAHGLDPVWTPTT